MKGIVIVGGSAEAHDLAGNLPGAHVLLPGPERVVRRWPGQATRGSLAASEFRALGARVIVEAAHPCDGATAFAVARAARESGVPVLQLVRPPWRASWRDLWVALRNASEAARVIPPGARVLVTTGRDTLPGLRALRAEVLMRRIGRTAAPFPLRRGRYLCAEGPFDEFIERRLLRKERIDWLLVHNAGGGGGWPKLAAARHLGLPVAMLNRPRRPDGPSVQTVREALAWLHATAP
jgi:precorrin-6A/cobalt-precorrin-6A reductase